MHEPQKIADVMDDRAAEITELLAYRLHQVANLVSRSAAVHYKREFGVILWEWRTIALLGAASAMSLTELARASSIDKGQLSRVVSGLIARDLVQRKVDKVDTRKISLSLTPTGQEIYKGLNRRSNERNKEFLACLTDVERACLDSILKKLEIKAREMINQEKKA